VGIQEDYLMTNSIAVALLASFALMLPAASAAADSCSDQIAKFQQAMPHDVRGALPIHGTAPQSIAAQLNHQPTPKSVREAQEGARAQVIDTLARARMLSAEGKEQACQAAIAKAKLLINP
jgi:hypothetical protein